MYLNLGKNMFQRDFFYCLSAAMKMSGVVQYSVILASAPKTHEDSILSLG